MFAESLFEPFQASGVKHSKAAALLADDFKLVHIQQFGQVERSGSMSLRFDCGLQVGRSVFALLPQARSGRVFCFHFLVLSFAAMPSWHASRPPLRRWALVRVISLSLAFRTPTKHHAYPQASSLASLSRLFASTS